METGEIVGHVATTGLALIMFSMGMGLKVSDFVRVLTSPFAVLVGLVGQILLLPLIGFAISKLLNLSPALAIGIMVLACCPGGPTSNALSQIAKGDTALSISLTAVSSFIAFLSAPFIIGLALIHFQIEGQSLSLPFVETSVKIFVTTVIPVCLGMVVGAHFEGFAASMRMKIFYFGFSVVIGTSALLLVSRAELLTRWDAFLAALALNVTMMVIAYGLGMVLLRDVKPVRSITVEVGLQNVSLAIVIIVGSLGVLDMLSPTLFYLPIAYITGFAFAYFAGRSDKSTSPATETAQGRS